MLAVCFGRPKIVYLASSTVTLRLVLVHYDKTRDGAVTVHTTTNIVALFSASTYTDTGVYGKSLDLHVRFSASSRDYTRKWGAVKYQAGTMDVQGVVFLVGLAFGLEIPMR